MPRKKKSDAVVAARFTAPPGVTVRFCPVDARRLMTVATMQAIDGERIDGAIVRVRLGEEPEEAGRDLSAFLRERGAVAVKLIPAVVGPAVVVAPGVAPLPRQQARAVVAEMVAAAVGVSREALTVFVSRVMDEERI